ncbi:MAG: BsaWI family type II restriction enzyme [Patescibacteria group bacterium]|nr:BsaWI family type II restriction enzyme [Patescibacteria group bacterium]MEA3428195.1 BsaWI family type II restriction enzyme [Thermodesulfobacteriota bacterium]
MKFENLKELYLQKKKQFGADTYKHISQLLKEAKIFHKKDWLKNPTKNKDHEQSWRAFKGKNLEKLIQHIITEEVENLGLKVVNGNKLERSVNLPLELSKVKRNLAIDYGEFGLHLPDVDIIIYNQNSCKVLVVISSKVTLRERIAQTGYWKLKFLQDEATKHIRVYFVTPDEDGTLTHKKPIKKGRAIVEVDLDGSYVLTEEEVEESNKVKLFKHFIEDLKGLLKNDN